MAELETNVNSTPPGKPAVFACPECGGTLWEIDEENLLRFRCRVGHAFSAQSLMADQAEALEEALWTALRALEEHAALSRRLPERAKSRGQTRSFEQFEDQARGTEENARKTREALQRGLLNTEALESQTNENSD